MTAAAGPVFVRASQEETMPSYLVAFVAPGRTKEHLFIKASQSMIESNELYFLKPSAVMQLY